jgi:hypothetical protein
MESVAGVTVCAGNERESVSIRPEELRATDMKLGRTVAVKVIHAAHAEGRSFVERFPREARLVASVEHPPSRFWSRRLCRRPQAPPPPAEPSRLDRGGGLL